MACGQANLGALWPAAKAASRHQRGLIARLFRVKSTSRYGASGLSAHVLAERWLQPPAGKVPSPNRRVPLEVEQGQPPEPKVGLPVAPLRLDILQQCLVL